ncbi:MAG: xylose isomerase [Clostridiales bacterium GWF2_38_85]|nr:MAG: xylose isomerase [Clostridiales bacterium GWF2_38_85]HBL84626.1 sugar phosphate isomerase/epimerase [Clostridiales bacterium]
MKLSFSTLGCPGWSWKEIYATAFDFGFDGIEIRGLENEMYIPKFPKFADNNIENIKRIFSGLTKISMLTSGAVIGNPKNVSPFYKEATDYIDLAAKLDVPFIRLMISPQPYPTEADYKFAVETYKKICTYAKDTGVSPLIETNGILAETKKMKQFMKDVNCENGGVLWDIHHPYRFFGESVSETLGNIGEYVKYLHVKDSEKIDTKIEYRMIGYGDMPVSEVISSLKSLGFEGYLSLEWVKRWLPELQEPGIVFSHYLNYMSYMLK